MLSMLSDFLGSFFSHIGLKGLKLNAFLLIIGSLFLFAGISEVSFAQVSSPSTVKIDTRLIGEAACTIITLLEGNFGALLMVIAGLGTIVSSALGNYRLAVSLLVVACASFTLISFVEIFFNYKGCNPKTGVYTAPVG